jgi:hypothetical protein
MLGSHFCFEGVDILTFLYISMVVSMQRKTNIGLAKVDYFLNYIGIT